MNQYPASTYIRDDEPRFIEDVEGDDFGNLQKARFKAISAEREIVSAWVAES